MVCCELRQITNGTAVYNYGPSPYDLSGKVTMYSDARLFTITDKYARVSEQMLMRVWLKHKQPILAGNFPKRMAIENG